MQFGKALTAALGLSLQALVLTDKTAQGPYGPMQAETFAIAIPGQTFGVQAQMVNEGGESIDIKAAALEAADGKAWSIVAKPAGEIKPEPSRRMGPMAPVKISAAPTSVAARQDAKFQFSVTAPADAGFTRPYFSRDDEEQPYYDIKDPRYRNLSLMPYPLSATVQVSYQGAAFPVSEVVQTFQRTSGLGLLSNPLLVGPEVSVTIAPAAGAVPLGTKSFSFAVTIHSNVKGAAQGTLKLSLPTGWKSSPGLRTLFHGARWRGSDRLLHRLAGLRESRRLQDHSGCHVQWQAVHGGLPDGRLFRSAAVSVLPPGRLSRGRC